MSHDLTEFYERLSHDDELQGESNSISNQWIIDEVASPIVKRIFRMTLEGYGPYQIATQFTAEQIPIPACHQAQ